MCVLVKSTSSPLFVCVLKPRDFEVSAVKFVVQNHQWSLSTQFLSSNRETKQREATEKQQEKKERTEAWSKISQPIRGAQPARSNKNKEK